MSENGKDVYEALRADVVCGTACARRMGAIVFHGLWRGLAVLIASHQSAIARQQSTPRLKTTSLVAHDRQLVHMLANMVLAAETGGSHVY
ncbi:hypothetical protein GOC40_33370 [Sinorhizobium meliloti]|nr:hypothetical protein [Sinorhizobium meliloti]MDW9776369.1 hypothetical protein [Sinorhizobium meliloti]MDW9850773.1 hypothetical protein [Sinorhizobium meliloti]MDX0153863.1 hypothetical protein [Sinorhizobium meliloti]MDX0172989.1 hypothetical protein [Sinorhizobium meliloti]